jgi:hypothetical protein
MKHALFVSTLAGAMLFYACKKDDKTITVTETVNDTIINTIFPNGQVDPNSLSDGITVTYGTKVSDSLLPAASADAGGPMLDSLYEREYTAAKGRYLFLTPPGARGTVAGYYFQIVGARSYHKITYPAIVNDLRHKNGTAARFEGDNADSVIMVKLPIDIKGDTFRVKYAAYDADGRVSNALTARVILLPQGSTAFIDSLAGTWKYYGYKSRGQNNAPPRVGAKIAGKDDFEADTLNGWAQTNFICDNNKLVETGNGDLALKYVYYTKARTLLFGQATFQDQTVYATHTLDRENSACDNLVYIKSTQDPYTNNYDFAFDPATRTLYKIFSHNTNTNVYYMKYHVDELSANRLVLSYDDSEGSDDMYMMTELYTR